MRESLEFSALLRQPRDIPGMLQAIMTESNHSNLLNAEDKEKLAYVDTIIDLCTPLGDILSNILISYQWSLVI